MPPLVVDRASIVGTTITIALGHGAGDSARPVVTVEILEREADKRADTTLESGAPRDKQAVVNDDNEDLSNAEHTTSQDLLHCQTEIARLTAHLADADQALGLSDDERNELEYQVGRYREAAVGVERERQQLRDLIRAGEEQLGAANTRAQELETELTDAHQTIAEQSGVLDMLAGATIAAVPC